jgi:hypothetical protein
MIATGALPQGRCGTKLLANGVAPVEIAKLGTGRSSVYRAIRERYIAINGHVKAS